MKNVKKTIYGQHIGSVTVWGSTSGAEPGNLQHKYLQILKQNIANSVPSQTSISSNIYGHIWRISLTKDLKDPIKYEWEWIDPSYCKNEFSSGVSFRKETLPFSLPFRGWNENYFKSFIILIFTYYLIRWNQDKPFPIGWQVMVGRKTHSRRASTSSSTSKTMKYDDGSLMV